MRDAYLSVLLFLAVAVLGGGGLFAWRCLTRFELSDEEVAGVVFVCLVAVGVACWLLWVAGRAVGVFAR